MKHLTSNSTASALVLAATNAVYAQYTPPPAPAPSAAPAIPGAGVLNDWLIEQSPAWKPWDIGGQVRVRYETRENFAVAGNGPIAVDFNAANPVPINDYLLSRERLHVGYVPCDGFTIYGEGQNSADFGDQRNPNPDKDAGFNLYQSYVNLGTMAKFPITAKIGRQEMNYGDERLIGSFGWNNIGRVFDAAKVRYEDDLFRVDAFTGNLVIPDATLLNTDNQYEWFSGVYASSRKLIPNQETQAYFLAQNASQKSLTIKGDAGVNGDSPRDIYTIGMRVKSLPGQFKGWDYEAEAAGQFGDFEYLPNTPTVVNGNRLKQSAYAVHGAGGYTFENAWGTPRVGLEYNQASGDTDPTDGKHETFVNLYPTNHKFYGFMDFFSWQNLRNPGLTASINPMKNLRLTVNYQAFWLATTDDFFYQANLQPRTTGGYGIKPNEGSFVGQETDVIVSYTFPRAAVLEGGYGHFFVGNYMDSSLANTGGATDANWFYLQLTVNF